MTKHTTPRAPNVWEAIEREKGRDRFLKRVSVAAWTVTFILVMILAVMICVQVAQMAKGALVGALPWVAVVGAAMPLVIVIGLLSVLVATLSTIGMFLRMRTASLTEIQLRLAALEGMLASQNEGSSSSAETRR